MNQLAPRTRLWLSTLAIGLGWCAFFSASGHAEFCGLQCSAEDELKGILAATEANENLPSPQYCGGGARGAIEFGEAAVTGARRVMAMIYGTCDVLKLPIRTEIAASKAIKSGFRRVDYPDRKPSFRRVITNKETILKQHPYLQTRQAPGCDDRKVCANAKARAALTACQQWSCQTLDYPPLYQYGAKPVGPESKIHQTYSLHFRSDFWKKAPGIDCSSFISLAFASMGLKMLVEEESVTRADSLSSGGMMVLGRGQKLVARKGKTVAVKADTCLDSVVENGTLKPGDVLAIKGHLAMVDTVGPDPFGNAEIASRSMEQWQELLDLARSDYAGKVKGCHEKNLVEMLESKESLREDRDCLTEAAMNICDAHHGSKDRPPYRVTMIHSTGNADVGVQRERFAGAFNPSGLLRTTLVLKAEVDCALKLKQEWLARAEVSDDPELREWAAISGYEARVKARGGDLIRHRSDDPRCRVSSDKIPKVDGWECTSCCDTATTFEQQVGVKHGG